MTGYRSGFVAGVPELDRGPARVPADRRHGAAGVRSARLGRRVGRRGARRAARRVPTQAAALPRLLRPEAGPCNRQPGDHVHVAAVPRGENPGPRRSPSGCSSTACSSRPAPIWEPPAKVTSGSRSYPPRTTAAGRSRSWRTCCEPRTRRGDRRGTRQWRAARGEQGGDEWVVDVEAKEAILEYFRLRKVEPMTVGPFSYQDKIPLKQPPPGVRMVPPGVALRPFLRKASC